METLTIIPARSGSKGIANKNIRAFCGQPLLSWTVKASVEAQSIDRVLVSTDSEGYADTARGAGAEVPFLRPASLAGDEASSESALLQALDWLRDHEGYQPDWLVFLQCTSPFTRSEDIDALVRKVIESGADSGLTVTRNHRFLWREDADANAIGINHDKAVRKRRQDMEPEFAENGAVYVVRVNGFRQHGHRFFGKTVMHEVPSHHAIELDSPEDWEIAEAIFRTREADRLRAPLPDPVRLVVFDFDGVFTDNRVMVDQEGKEAVFCDRGDGMALSWLCEAGIPALILSKERNSVVGARAAKLGIEVAQAIDDKVSHLTALCAQREIPIQNVVYLGNDLNDLECIKQVGCGIAVADAVSIVQTHADLVLTHPGGRGAIRELVERILKKHQAPESIHTRSSNI